MKTCPHCAATLDPRTGRCMECAREKRNERRRLARAQKAMPIQPSLANQLEVQRVWRPTTTK